MCVAHFYSVHMLFELAERVRSKVLQAAASKILMLYNTVQLTYHLYTQCTLWLNHWYVYMSSVLGWAVIQRRQKVWQNWHTFTPSGQARPGQARQPAGLGEYSGYIHTYVHTYLILRATYVLPCNIWMSSVYTHYTSTWSNPSLAL